MSHRRYQNPHKGYSRRDHRHIEDDSSLWSAEDKVMTELPDAPLAPLMQVEPTAPVGAPVAVELPPVQAAPPTRLNHGTAFQIDEAQTNSKIRALDRLLAVIRKSR